ncbi:MAG: response regulator transcription factor [Tannerella sp.]|nr:response regulator transcription factor [Tannerella sp.]
MIRLLIRYPNAIIMIDYGLFDLSGPDNLFIISLRFPHTRWIFFGDDLSDNFLRRIVPDRRFSVVMKDAPVEEIEQAFRLAVLRKPYICERVRIHLKSKIKKDENERLTSTEREILKSIAQGKTSQMIADERSLSIHTIATHRKNIFRKIGVNNVLEASRYAARAGVIDVGNYYI